MESTQSAEEMLSFRGRSSAAKVGRQAVPGKTPLTTLTGEQDLRRFPLGLIPKQHERPAHVLPGQGT